MKKLILILLTILALGCSPIRRVVTEYKTEYVIKDSISIRDSVRITDKERVVDVVAVYDTLHLETSLASSKTWVDTTLHMLKGSIENKDKIVEHIKYVDKWHTKDSLVYKEVPVEVKKPVYKHYPYEKYLWVYLFLTLAGVGIIIYMKIMKH